MASSRQLAGKVAIVTASTQGIGLAIARTLGRDGASVVVSSRKQKLVSSRILQHYPTDLAALDLMYLTVSNFHFGAPSGTDSEFTSDASTVSHKLESGPYRGPLYGFEIAAVSKFPRCVLDKARAIADELVAQRADRLSANEEQRRSRITFKFGARVLRAVELLKSGRVSKDEIYEYFQKVKEEFTDAVAEYVAEAEQ